jgi:hypothetical protein
MDDVLEAKILGVAIVGHMIGILVGAGIIHVSGVPVAVHRDALRSPMCPDAEFGILIPLRGLVIEERLPRRTEGTHFHCLAYRG